MKKLVLTLTALTLVSAGAFAQGKIGFTTDSAHLAYYDPSVGGSLGGTAISSANGANLVADLYMGTSSGTLTLYSSTTFSVSPGKWNSLNVSASNPFIGGGTSVFVVTQIRNSSSAAPQTLLAGDLANPAQLALQNGFSSYGWSQEFTFTLGSSVTFPVMATSPTWSAGTFDLSATAGPGTKGAIAVFSVPEPTTLAFGGMALAAGLIMRRRK